MSSEIFPPPIPCYQGISEFLSAKIQGQFTLAAIGKTALTLISWAIARMFERALSYCSLAFSSRSSRSSSEAPCLIKHGQLPWRKKNEEIQNPDFFARSCSAFSTDSSLRWRSSTVLGFSTRSQYSVALSVHAYIQRKNSFEGWFGRERKKEPVRDIQQTLLEVHRRPESPYRPAVVPLEAVFRSASHSVELLLVPRQHLRARAVKNSVRWSLQI